MHKRSKDKRFIRYTDLRSCPGNKRANTVERLDDLRPKHYPGVPIPLSQAPAGRQDPRNSPPSDIDTRTYFDLWRRSRLDTSRRFLRKSFPRKYPEMIHTKKKYNSDKKLIRANLRSASTYSINLVESLPPFLRCLYVSRGLNGPLQPASPDS